MRTLTWDQGREMARHQRYLDAIAYELNNYPRAILGYHPPHRSIQRTHYYHPLTPPSIETIDSPRFNACTGISLAPTDSVNVTGHTLTTNPRSRETAGV